MWSGCFTQNRRSSSHVTITERSNMFFFALPEDSQLPRQPAAKPYGRLKLIQNHLTLMFLPFSLSLRQRCKKCLRDLRLFNMTRAAGGLVTGTACSASNTWPLATTWLQRSVGYRSGVSEKVNMSCLRLIYSGIYSDLLNTFRWIQSMKKSAWSHAPR